MDEISCNYKRFRAPGLLRWSGGWTSSVWDPTLFLQRTRHGSSKELKRLPSAHSAHSGYNSKSSRLLPSENFPGIHILEKAKGITWELKASWSEKFVFELTRPQLFILYTSVLIRLDDFQEKGLIRVQQEVSDTLRSDLIMVCFGRSGISTRWPCAQPVPRQYTESSVPVELRSLHLRGPALQGGSDTAKSSTVHYSRMCGAVRWSEKRRAAYMNSIRLLPN